MARTFLSTGELLAILPETPNVIQRASEGLSEAQLRLPPAEGEWSMNEILAHLRSCADIWGDATAAIAVEGASTLRAVDPRSWTPKSGYLDLGFRESFDGYRAQRQKLLTLLRGFGPEDWSRTVTVTGAGAPLQRSVHFYAQWMARHERSHRRQIERTGAAVRG